MIPVTWLSSVVGFVVSRILTSRRTVTQQSQLHCNRFSLLWTESMWKMRTLLLVLACTVCLTKAWTPRFFRGRPKGGLVPPPPRHESMLGKPVSPDLWLNQTLDHFNDADTRTFRQVNGLKHFLSFLLLHLFRPFLRVQNQVHRACCWFYICGVLRRLCGLWKW